MDLQRGDCQAERERRVLGQNLCKVLVLGHDTGSRCGLVPGRYDGLDIGWDRGQVLHRGEGPDMNWGWGLVRGRNQDPDWSWGCWRGNMCPFHW